MIVNPKKNGIVILTLAKEILSNVFNKKATVMFPSEQVPLPDLYRGLPQLNRVDDCIACGRCAKECPTHCIDIQEVSKEEKKFTLTVNQAQCMFCGVCAEVCSKNAIDMSSEWLLADTDKSSFIKTYTVFRKKKTRK